MYIDEATLDHTIPIRWSRVLPSGVLVGILVWPILGLIIGYLVPESMWDDPGLLQISLEFFLGSGVLSGILVLLLMKQRRLIHLVFTIAVSAPISLGVLLIIAFITHRP
jgi:hypothetical protein